MTPEARWIHELEAPTEAFFGAYAARIAEPEGLRGALREAIRLLVPVVDWEGSLPQPPRNLLGLRAAMALRPHLQESRFHRLMVLQLHGLARSPRSSPTQGLHAISKGSGHWPQVELALRKRLPSLAWGEVQGIDAPESLAFQRIAEAVRSDMAGLGQRLIWADQLGDLFLRLDAPKATGRRLLGLAAWFGATEPVDVFWSQRAAKRLGQGAAGPRPGPPVLGVGERSARVEELCEAGLVALLDAVCTWIRQGISRDDLLAILVQAAAERLLDARRDLEGKTGWPLIYLSSLARRLELHPEPWAQAAALVNFFPGEDAEARIQAQPVASASDAGLREAILDSEPERALGQARALPPARSLPVLAEVVALNDPAFNQGLQALSLAAAAELLPLLPGDVQVLLLGALAKSYANSQGSGDLGDRAERELQR